ncbi:MAG: TIM barrel protein [Chloroflexi bacterium]|nr:TIM barrel protein [Chloroflexota bacterium]
MLSERLAANVAWLFSELPWPDRFAAAREVGFGAVEFPWPDDSAVTVEAVRSANLRVALLNMPAGALAAGERGWPNDPSRVREWRDAFAEALEMAHDLGCPTVNVLAGNAVPGVARPTQLACLQQNLGWALAPARDAGVTLVTELLNREENPEYLLVTLDDAEPLLESLAVRGWRLQLDCYHLGLTEPDVPAAIRRAGERIGHIQVADLPGRHEPYSGRLDWDEIGSALDQVGYAGFVGCEYTPLAGLGWTERLPFASAGVASAPPGTTGRRPAHPPPRRTGSPAGR